MAEIVPVHLAVQAMRDNGYKNAAYALSELMDNSIQAGASVVELLCAEKEIQLDQRCVSRIYKIAVLDNGTGMDTDVLQMALQFGNGTYLDPDKHVGIGRFGMGLPCSSVSQCTRVDVWTWQNGPDSAIHSYLDLKQIRNKELRTVPEPENKAIPDVWKKIGQNFDNSGTIVVWSNLDRCVWRTARSIISNSEFLIGRMYRKFLEDDKVRIRMVAFDIDNPDGEVEEIFAKANDPGYLMEETSCPRPFDIQPMFKPWGDENHTRTIEVDFQGKKHEVKIRFSLAKEEARQYIEGKNPGSLPHGKHAAKNVGVSIVRADRELDLEQAWVIKYTPTERWWGIEVDFPPSLDDLFGVTNNKQSARNFAELAKIDLSSLLKGGKTITELKEELLGEGDPRGPLIEIAQAIYSNLRVMRKNIVTQAKGARGRRTRYPGTTPEEIATAVTNERKNEGYTGASDGEENLPNDERKGIIEEALEEEGLMKSTAEELAAFTVDSGLKYIFANADLETSAFFSVKPKGGAIIITLNLNHPAYKNLLEILEEDVEDADVDTLKARLENSLNGIKLLLSAWARYEDEQPDGIRRERVQDARADWGRIARQFLERK